MSLELSGVLREEFTFRHRLGGHLGAGHGDPEVSVGLFAALEVHVANSGSVCSSAKDSHRVCTCLEGTLPLGVPFELEGDIFVSLETCLGGIEDIKVTNDGLVSEFNGNLGKSAGRVSSVEASLVDSESLDVAGTECVLSKIDVVFSASSRSVLGEVSSASVIDSLYLIWNSL